MSNVRSHLAQSSPHSKILASAGKFYLAPLGLKRRSKSRVWIKDNFWWLAIVEFQPSGWSKGSYLNVAAMWLWHPREHLVFDEYERVGSFAAFTDAESFSLAADALGKLAALETSKNLARFASVDTVAKYLTGRAATDPRQQYHAMMAFLAVNDLESARAQQATLASVDYSVAWYTALQAKAEGIVQAATILAPKDVVAAEVQNAREMLKLPVIPNAELWA